MTQGRRGRPKAASSVPKPDALVKVQKETLDLNLLESVPVQTPAALEIQPKSVLKTSTLTLRIENHSLHHRFEPSSNTQLLANKITPIECKSEMHKQQVISNIRQLNELKSNEMLEVLDD